MDLPVLKKQDLHGPIGPGKLEKICGGGGGGSDCHEKKAVQAQPHTCQYLFVN